MNESTQYSQLNHYLTSIPVELDEDQRQYNTISTNHECLELEDNHCLEKKQRHWGKCKPFYFYNAQIPQIVIGPHWPLFSVAFLLFFILSGTMVSFVIQSNFSTQILCMTIIVSITQIFTYMTVALINPGVANIQNIQLEPTGTDSKRRRDQNWFCGICKLGQLPKTVHCNDCDVCILELDHHCPWTGKCIGKDNLKPFYTFLISTLIYMIFNISLCFNQSLYRVQTFQQQ